MANSHKLLAALNTSLNVHDNVVKLAKRTFSPPRLNLFQCHIVQIGILVFELLIIGNEEEGFRGKVDNMALAAESVRFGIILNVKLAKKGYKC
jgi:hypothetical protein